MGGTTVDFGPVVDARAGAQGTRIDLDDVCRRFTVGAGVVKALDQVNLHVDESAFLVVLGPSGSGKTTLLNLVGALDAPTSGTVLLLLTGVLGSAAQVNRWLPTGLLGALADLTAGQSTGYYLPGLAVTLVLIALALTGAVLLGDRREL